jgi:hypothetical protein
VDALPAVILSVVLVALVAGLVWFRRYSRTEAFRKGELRRATFEFLVIIGPFFGVRVKPPEPEPAAVLTPKGDTEDPLAARVTYTTGDEQCGDDGGAHDDALPPRSSRQGTDAKGPVL